MFRQSKREVKYRLDLARAVRLITVGNHHHLQQTRDRFPETKITSTDVQIILL